ncbi:mediator of RNA polymerase II transcription subunit 13 [Aspergillus nanangensis]|uniref:Mediator of RNA polymerase II transcription subunit 13 n=1 Tax=Aspergillus nanangensis TaxID=2582783 RepID=A0AAD4CKN0_ASPNN|nr:mediator of RNA polymerase II transcription subunit 13 [Aspergillus nanangensis]
MDFPGASITNIRVIDGFSNIYYRIYTEEQSIPNVPGEANAYTILRHLSRLKDLELKLRNLDCLVASISRRLGLWVFSATPDFESLSPLCANDGKDDQGRLLIGSSALKVSASGSVLSSDLVKTLSTDSPNSGVNSAGPQRPQNAPNSSRRTDTYGSSALMYALFVSAVTGALNLQLIRRHNAIPLGPRTLFTIVDGDCSVEPGITNKDPSSRPCLSTLQVQLTAIGKITVSFQTISQPGLTRLRQPGDSFTDVKGVIPGTDIWLSPSGTIARLVSTNPTVLNTSSPHPSTHFKNDMITADPKQWQANVLNWLQNFGLDVESADDILWVEVEVWEPFYSRLAGETWRPNDSSSTIPLKRILWPDIYCFRRVKSVTTELANWVEGETDDPLSFAQIWHGKHLPKLKEPSPKSPPGQQNNETKDLDHFDNSDFPEGIESLSRLSQYPELQTASLVYPTPPDGATALGSNPTLPTDGFVDYSDPGSSAMQNHGNLKSLEQLPNHSGHNSTEFGSSTGLLVGSGLYDTNMDDDLFGDMNERDFGAKGITDADFSFFDDPGFDNLDADAPDRDAQKMLDLMDPGESTNQPAYVENVFPEEPPQPKTPAQQMNLPQIVTSDNMPTSQHAETPTNNSPMNYSPHSEKKQPISPPLSPVEVKRILFPGSNEESPRLSRKGKAQSYYNPIAFKKDMSAWDEKYGAYGKFGFALAGPSASKEPAKSMGDIPTIGLPRRIRKSVATSVSTKGIDEHNSPSSVIGQQEISCSDSYSDTSDDSDDNILEREASSAIISSRKRKRARSNSGGSQALSQAKSPGEVNQGSPAPRAEFSIFLGNFLSTSSDWSMAGYFSFQENQVFPVLPAKDVQVQIAQLLVDQVTQSSLDHKFDGACSLANLDTGACSIRTFLEDSAFMGGIERLDLNSFVSLQDNTDPSPTPNGTSSRSVQRKDTLKGSMSKLPPPHLRIRRGKEYLEALPPTVFFWETFSLEPAHGPKDVSAYCIHPSIALDAADAFLERLGSLYSSCNLGKHTRGDRSSTFDRGLGSWDVGSEEVPDYDSAMQCLKGICEELGAALLKSPPSKDNLVIYIINPFSHAAGLADICSAFWSLFQKYVADADKQNLSLDELVLQIVPIDFILSTESLVIPPQTQYLNLALEVYSRCPPGDMQSSLVNCAPPVLIADPLPKSIHFRLASERTSPLQEGKCLHIASSRSQDQRWITVAWSDNTGTLQRTMSYNLRFRNAGAYRSLQDVRCEIWGATKDIIERIQARWRIAIVNSDPVDQDEVDSWTNLVDQHNKTSAVPIELTILGVNAASDLCLEPPILPIPMSVFNPQTSSTPIATPNPSSNVLSPDQTFNASTPPSGTYGAANAPTPSESALESESESLVADICDETWGVTLSHRLNSSPHLMDFRPALASGYLIRRKGATDGDGMYTMSVNLIYTQRPTSSYEALLREILQMYRDLATLARIRGTRTVQHSAMPWHIATAIQAQETLSQVM